MHRFPTCTRSSQRGPTTRMKYAANFVSTIGFQATSLSLPMDTLHEYSDERIALLQVGLLALHSLHPSTLHPSTPLSLASRPSLSLSLSYSLADSDCSALLHR